MIIEIILDIKMTIASVNMISTSVEIVDIKTMIVDIIRVAMVTVMVYGHWPGMLRNGKYFAGWERVNISKKGVLPPKFSKIFVWWGKARIIVHIIFFQ